MSAQLVTSHVALRAAYVERRALDPEMRIAVVPTMGALHGGHASLMHAAREAVGRTGLVVVTVFVNPTQFGPGEDYDRYPRTMDADLALCQQAGVDLVYAPEVMDVYGTDDLTSLTDQVMVVPGPLGSELEGASRPGHFAGVLTVVAKLFHLTAPDVACFGEKDYQQLALIARMVRDLRFGIEVLPVVTVREPDGLAMSSRNRYLSPAERATAALIPAALDAVIAAAPQGIDAALAAGRDVLAQDPSIDLDYLVIRSVDLGQAPTSGDARVLIAARVGTARLLDNQPVVIGA